MTQQEKKSVYDIVTDKIIDNLEKGQIPWRKTWNGGDSLPQNLFTKRHYSGINILMLAYSGFTSPYFATFKQITEHGGKIKKGSRSEVVTFWKIGNKKIKETDPDTGEEKTITQKTFLLRYYNVFNVEQTEGLEKYIPKVELKDFDPIAKAEEIINNYKNAPAIFNNGVDSAYYSPRKDEIHLPLKEVFEKSEFYYSTLFHEATHSTGHKDRLNRFTNSDQFIFASESYSKEELVAEMGASFLSGISGIENEVIENNSAYIQGWISELKKDKRLIVFASSQAQKAVNFILGDIDNDE